MTQEQKAKAYDEVLEKAKSLHQDSQIDFKKSLENLFPELKESDDEKIRKALIFHYQGDGCICTNEYRIDFKDIRAWLERQGKSKTADKAEKAIANAGYAFDFENKELEEEIGMVKGDYEQVNVAWNNDFDFIARHFANYQKQQMMKNAIDAEVQSYGLFTPLISVKDYKKKIPNVKFGDKVKVLIFKEETNS